jgi:hypothetical protein
VGRRRCLQACRASAHSNFQAGAAQNVEIWVNAYAMISCATSAMQLMRKLNSATTCAASCKSWVPSRGFTFVLVALDIDPARVCDSASASTSQASARSPAHAIIRSHRPQLTISHFLSLGSLFLRTRERSSASIVDQRFLLVDSSERSTVRLPFMQRVCPDLRRTLRAMMSLFLPASSAAFFMGC